LVFKLHAGLIFATVELEIDFEGFVPIVVVQVVEDYFFQLVLGQGKLAHHEGVETVAYFLAKRTLNPAFELALHEVHYD
jgi:hypothetical protein